MTCETIPAMRARHAEEIRAAIEEQAQARLTQTQAAKRLGLSLTALNNICQRKGIWFPVKRQGFKTESPQ